jgi:hypothetical protein
MLLLPRADGGGTRVAQGTGSMDRTHKKANDRCLADPSSIGTRREVTLWGDPIPSDGGPPGATELQRFEA